MLLRYMFGPITPEFADQNLRSLRQAGQCLAFDRQGSTDLAIGPGDRWDDVVARLPNNWWPDFIALWLPYTVIPPCLWTAPVPIIGLAADWNLLFHGYRRLALRQCDLLLTDQAGVAAFARAGCARGRYANLFGLERAFLDDAVPETERTIDILFCGNLHGAVQRERLPWLGRLARLGERWRVAIHTGVFGADYRALLRRARVVYNQAIRGECNKRVFESAISGALLPAGPRREKIREEGTGGNRGNGDFESPPPLTLFPPVQAFLSGASPPRPRRRPHNHRAG